MNFEETHREKHIKLHTALIELVQGYLHYTGQHTTNTTLKDLIDWSLQETEIRNKRNNPAFRIEDPVTTQPPKAVLPPLSSEKE